MAAKSPLKKWALGVGRTVVLLGALGGTFGLFALFALQIALETREVDVPNLRGLTPEEAQVVLVNAGLNLRTEPIRRVHETITMGRIAEQDPMAGLTTRSQRSVTTWLSSGPTPDSLPGLIGASEQAAKLSLADNSFSLNGLAEIRSNRYPVDAVVAQEGLSDNSGQRVSLLVNRGERGRTFVMPDLIGIASQTASSVLRSQGFRITVVDDHLYPGVPTGIILRQSPEAGFQIAPGESISLEVSQ
jgi:serine/threonine-protein kinase